MKHLLKELAAVTFYNLAVFCNEVSKLLNTDPAETKILETTTSEFVSDLTEQFENSILKRGEN